VPTVASLYAGDGASSLSCFIFLRRVPNPRFSLHRPSSLPPLLIFIAHFFVFPHRLFAPHGRESRSQTVHVQSPRVRQVLCARGTFEETCAEYTYLGET
jgi:hypothetical protein